MSFFASWRVAGKETIISVEWTATSDRQEAENMSMFYFFLFSCLYLLLRTRVQHLCCACQTRHSPATRAWRLVSLSGPRQQCFWDIAFIIIVSPSVSNHIILHQVGHYSSLFLLIRQGQLRAVFVFADANKWSTFKYVCVTQIEIYFKQTNK